jgi:hypothetical protein
VLPEHSGLRIEDESQNELDRDYGIERAVNDASREALQEYEPEVAEA